MGGDKKNKIKASSLFESVVSIAIISIVITIAMVVFFNVTNGVNKQIVDCQLINEIEKLKNNVFTDKIKESKRRFFFKEYEIVQVKKKGKKEIFFMRYNVFKKGKVVLKKEYILRSEIN